MSWQNSHDWKGSAANLSFSESNGGVTLLWSWALVAASNLFWIDCPQPVCHVVDLQGPRTGTLASLCGSVSAVTLARDGLRLSNHHFIPAALAPWEAVMSL